MRKAERARGELGLDIHPKQKVSNTLAGMVDIELYSLHNLYK